MNVITLDGGNASVAMERNGVMETFGGGRNSYLIRLKIGFIGEELLHGEELPHYDTITDSKVVDNNSVN